jgi:DNA-binding CsgD family transcriptional regulator
MATALDPALLDAIYDIAVGDRRWDQILRLAAESFGCPMSSMICEDSEYRIASLVTIGTDDSASSEYIAHYHLLDFVSEEVRKMEPGQVFVFRDLVGDPRYRSNPYSQEWLKRWDCEHMLGVRLHVFGGWEVGIGVNRSAGQAAFSNEEVAAFGELVPHLARVLRLHAAINTLPDPDGAPAFNDCLLVMVDSDLTLRGMTPTAEENLRAARVPLVARARKLRAASPFDQQRLERIVALGAAGNAIGPSGASFTTQFGATRFRISAMPLSARSSDWPDMETRATVAILITDESAQDIAQASSGSRPAYDRLTATQASILDMLTGGLTAKEIADRRGVSPETVRQHIKAIRARVGARNQKQLVAMAMRGVAADSAAGL